MAEGDTLDFFPGRGSSNDERAICRRAGCGSWQPFNTIGADRVPSLSQLFSRLRVWVDHVTGFVLGGRQDRGRRGPLELLQVVALDVVVLHPDRAAFGPFAICPKGNVADNRVECVTVDALAELVLV
jgi:hypothetical protein